MINLKSSGSLTASIEGKVPNSFEGFGFFSVSFRINEPSIAAQSKFLSPITPLLGLNDQRSLRRRRRVREVIPITRVPTPPKIMILPLRSVPHKVKMTENEETLYSRSKLLHAPATAMGRQL